MILEKLAENYPALYLKPGVEPQTYRNTAGKGIVPDKKNLNHFIGSEKDELILEKTPAGEVEVLFFDNRQDFETALQLLAYKGQKQQIPKTTGAMTLSGLINWGKINARKKEVFKENPLNWPEEFKLFTSKPENFRDVLILLSNGPYSNINHENIGLSAEEWKDISRKIRHYHELTHVICRKLFPDQIDALWDEVIADAMGLLYAFNTYKPDLAKLFLGVSSSGYTSGRLENYVSKELADDSEAMNDLAVKLSSLIDVLAQTIQEADHTDYFELLKELENKQQELTQQFNLSNQDN